MNTNHSPLPWEVAHTKQLEPFIINSTGKMTIANSINGETMKEAEANAQYIVQVCNAFPALVEALEACEKAMGKHPAFNVSNARLEARAALALARGENGYERKLTELTEKLRVFEKGESK